MRVFLIIDETYFYQPDFVADLIRKANHDFVGAALVTKIPNKSNIERYMVRHWYYLTFMEILKLGLKKTIFILKDAFLKKNRNARFYKVSTVFKYFQIDFFKVDGNINSRSYLHKIKAKSPDIIVSSNSLIFGKELLNIPKYCINRHCALLPSYGGLWPVFQAVRKGEEKTGVSVHLMNKQIDKGIILSQIGIPILPNDSIASLYRKCFAVSAEAVIKAFENIENGALPVQNDYAPSYFSFPKKRDWKEFRKRKKEFI